MYLSLKLQNNYSSYLSKIAVMSRSILIFILDFDQVFTCKEASYAGTVMLKLVIFTYNERARYRSFYFSLNET